MQSIWELISRIISLFRKRRLEDELSEELRHHLELTVDENIRRGMPEHEAWIAARRSFGGIELAKEHYRKQRGIPMIETLFLDIRHALRVLRQNPGFTIVAVLSLALGVGASTAIFSVVDAVLLRPLPYTNPDKIVRIWEQAPDGHRMNFADPNFDDLRSQNNTFAVMAEFSWWPSSVSGGSQPTRINIAQVTNGFFETFDVQPFRGRSFASDEQRIHGAQAAIVSYGYWQRYLDGKTDLSRLNLSMEGAVYPVVGVMPPEFDFPSDVAVWIPRNDEWNPARKGHNWRAVGRIRDGVTVAQARANLSTIARNIKEQYGKDVDLNAATVMTLADAMVGDVRTALLTLMAAVGLLLLVACANVAGLLLARTSARRKELAVRVALGAGRSRLIQQFLVESFTLSLAGGVLGVLIAFWAVRVLPAILPTDLPRQQGIAINLSVLLFATAAIIAVAVSLGLFAAWRATARDLREGLSAGSRGYSGSGASQRLRGLLVIGEIATTLVILIGAGLLGRSFIRLISTSPGFSQQNLITIEFSPVIPKGEISNESSIIGPVRQLDDILTRLRAIRGAESVAFAGSLPVAAGDNLADGPFLILNGQKPPANSAELARMTKDASQTGQATYCIASEAYFRTIGIPLIRGRMFNEQDSWNSQHVALISQSLARDRWPNQDPIGQEINYGNMDGIMKPLTIIGIVGDVRGAGLDRPPSPIIYVDYSQRGINWSQQPTILIRSAAPVGEIASAANGIFHDLAPGVPIKFSTFAEELGGWLSARRFLLLLVGLFASVALVLAAVGIYGVVAFSVTRRAQEIGIRMALGAQRTNVLGMILSEGARLAALGVVIGVAAAFVITRLLSTLLFGVSTTDPITFVGVAALLSMVALIASYIPARRAMRLDPMIALRNE